LDSLFYYVLYTLSGYAPFAYHVVKSVVHGALALAFFLLTCSPPHVMILQWQMQRSLAPKKERIWEQGLPV